MSISKHSIKETAVLFVIFSLCLLVIERYKFINGFSVLSGDRYDFSIVATILEHWFNFYTGKANWSDVLYFYPYQRSIAQTDAYFLVGMAYFPFRLFKLDPFISTEFAGYLIKAVGFFSMFILSKSKIKLTFCWSCVAALLFTLSNGMTIHDQRIQLATVAFAPLLAYLIWSGVESLIDENIYQFRKYGILSGVLFGAWCLTCFYMAWFFLFFTTFYIFFLYIIVDSNVRHLLRRRILENFFSIFLVICVSLISLLPFIWAFLPKSHEVGVRSYESVLSNTVSIIGILQPGTDNILWGRLYSGIIYYLFPAYTPNGEYYNTGFVLPIFLLFVFGAIELIKLWKNARSRKPLFAMVLATLFTWMLALNICGRSAWYFVYHLFPGAKALNVVSTYQLFLALPVVLIAVKYLSSKKIDPKFLGIILAILFVSELNKPYLNFNRALEMERVALSILPPKNCKVFYVSGYPNQSRHLEGFPERINNYYAHNVSAMLIAQLTRIPTINGIASFNPPDWNFGNPNSLDYEERIRHYMRSHDIAHLCRYDLTKKDWSEIVK
jgi:hypothetical protein